MRERQTKPGRAPHNRERKMKTGICEKCGCEMEIKTIPAHAGSDEYGEEIWIEAHDEPRTICDTCTAEALANDPQTMMGTLEYVLDYKIGRPEHGSYATVDTLREAVNIYTSQTGAHIHEGAISPATGKPAEYYICDGNCIL